MQKLHGFPKMLISAPNSEFRSSAPLAPSRLEPPRWAGNLRRNLSVTKISQQMRRRCRPDEPTEVKPDPGLRTRELLTEYLIWVEALVGAAVLQHSHKSIHQRVCPFANAFQMIPPSCGTACMGRAAWPLQSISWFFRWDEPLSGVFRAIVVLQWYVCMGFD